MRNKAVASAQMSRRDFAMRSMCGVALLSVSGGCATADAIDRSVAQAVSGERATGDTREIGLDLWVGAPVTPGGAAFNVRQGSRRMVGPETWTHPITGETLQTYLRINRERNGERIQRFAIRPDGQALGRVFDSRPGQSDRLFVNDAFFPLGRWGRGERRNFQITQYRDGSAETFRATIRIRRLSFTYRDQPNSLRYDWLLHDASGRKIFDERFEYTPGVGFVNFTNRMA